MGSHSKHRRPYDLAALAGVVSQYAGSVPRSGSPLDSSRMTSLLISEDVALGRPTLFGNHEEHKHRKVEMTGDDGVQIFGAVHSLRASGVPRITGGGVDRGLQPGVDTPPRT